MRTRAAFWKLRGRWGGRGPDACIDAVGMESHGFGLMGKVDRAMQTVRMQTDRPTALREAVHSCRKGGTVSIPDVYGGVFDKMDLGAASGKGLTFKTGQTHVQRCLPKRLKHIEENRIDPAFVISRRLPLDKGPQGYEMFLKKRDGCTEIVLKP